jgi:hypothetical protein
MNESQPFNYQQIINAAQLLGLNSPTAPPVGSQQYLITIGYINYLAIPAWENQRNVIWNELWVDQPNYSTLDVGTTSISLPSDFKFMFGGTVRITYPPLNSTFPPVVPYPIKRLPEMELNPYQTKKEFYVTGNIQQGFNLVLGWPIVAGDAEVGATVSFRYYKYANIAQVNSAGVLLNPYDVPEMSDPTFVFKKVTAAVSAANYNLNLYNIYENSAKDSLSNMIVGNEMNAYYQDDYDKDVDKLLGGLGASGNKMNSYYWTRGMYAGG